MAGVALLPLLNPKGPGNSAPVDAVMALGIGLVLIWAGVTRTPLHVPYTVPTTGLVLAGAAAALVSDTPASGGTAIVQEVFLLAWCACVTSVCRTSRVLRVVVRAWCLSATIWAALLVAAVLGGRPALAGVPSADGGRARQLFDHPNMAGNYFMISFFVILASRYPRRPLMRAFACAVVLGAVVLAGSNTALLSLPTAGLVMLFLKLRKRAGSVIAAAVVLFLVLAGAVTWTAAAEPVTSAIQKTDSSFVHYSVSRGPRSAEARQSLFASQYQLFQEGRLVGLGPAGTRHALKQASAPTAKESHNDYLATLVERGPVGVVALMLLIGTVALRAAGVDVGRLSAAFRSVMPNPSALVGACVSFLLTALTHEVLHYRHLWTLLAILAALHLFGRDPVGPADAEPSVPSLAGAPRPMSAVVPLRADGR